MLQADGGTRCASITGGYVALRLATQGLLEAGELERDPLTGSVAAISCGVVDGELLCDLDYSEDSRAEVDANIVMTGDGGLVEVQATAERTPVSRASLDELLGLAEPAIATLRRRRRGACGARCRTERVRLVVATRNQHKLASSARSSPRRELAPLRREVELPPEDGETFAENALIKARARARAPARRRSPTTPGSRRWRSAGGPESARPASRATMRPTSESLPAAARARRGRATAASPTCA